MKVMFLTLKWIIRKAWSKTISWLRKLRIMPKILYYVVFYLQLQHMKDDEVISLPLIFAVNDADDFKRILDEFISSLGVYKHRGNSTPREVTAREASSPEFLANAPAGSLIHIPISLPREAIPTFIIASNAVRGNTLIDDEIFLSIETPIENFKNQRSLRAVHSDVLNVFQHEIIYPTITFSVRRV